MKLLAAAALLFTLNVNALTINLEPENSLVFRGPVTAQSMNDLGDRLLNMHNRLAKDKDIYLSVDSPGGSVDAGITFRDVMLSIKPRKVHVISIYTASMAHHMLQHATGKRYSIYSGKSMAHRARGNFRGYFNNGEVESQLKFWKETVQQMEVINARRMKISIKKYKSKVVNEWWCRGQSCQTQGFVDHMVRIVCSKELLESRIEQTTQAFGFLRFMDKPTKKYYSKCPLLRLPVKVKKDKKKKRNWGLILPFLPFPRR